MLNFYIICVLDVDWGVRDIYFIGLNNWSLRIIGG